MRKLVIPIAAVALLATAAFLINRPGDVPVAEETGTAPPHTVKRAEHTAAIGQPELDVGNPAATPPKPSSSPLLRQLPSPVLSPFPEKSPDRAAWIANRRVEIFDLSWFDDEASMKTILSETRNPEPAIRMAAIDAVSNLGNRDAIPYLQAIAEETEDQELAGILGETVDFLELPPLDEVLKGRMKSLPVTEPSLPEEEPASDPSQ